MSSRLLKDGHCQFLNDEKADGLIPATKTTRAVVYTYVLVMIPVFPPLRCSLDFLSIGEFVENLKELLW